MSFIRTDSIETVKKRNVTSEKSTTDNVPPDYILVKEMTFQIFFFVLRLVDPLKDELIGLRGSASNATKMACQYTTRETLENRISLFLYHEKS